MKSAKMIYACQGCGYQSPKWLGRCPDCGDWNSFEAQAPIAPKAKRLSSTPPIKVLSALEVDDGADQRLITGIKELDRVLGGGIVPGSLILLGGDPGIGKSTLLLQALGALAEKELSCLYVSAEESVRQVRSRAQRLNMLSRRLYLLGETSMERILAALEETKPELVVLDSIQTVRMDGLESAAGNMTQIREATHCLMNYAKQSNVPVFLVGHVTKEGSLAGPKALEHLVDTVLSMEGEKGYPYRIIRSVKNRFGSTNEIGVFEMTEGGMKEVLNPSQLFLSERRPGSPGSVVVPTVEGVRPILVEIQALVSRASNRGFPPRRTAIGTDPNRLSLLVAVLEKRLGYELHDRDIFVNVTGGVKLSEPACDLGVVTALLSSFEEKALPHDTIFFGELGLGGELRSVTRHEPRFKEAAKLGFKACFCPSRNAKVADEAGLKVTGVSSLEELMPKLFARPASI